MDLPAASSSRSPDQSSLIDLAHEMFETPAEAESWMNRAHPLLGGQSPAEVTQTAQGVERVRDLLVALKYGGVV